MTRLILVCHGDTDWVIDKRIQGALEVPLNSEGKIQAVQIASDLEKMNVCGIYSSTLSRSFDTASEIAKAHKLKPKKLAELNDLNHGLWQGLLTSEVKKRYKKLFKAWEISPSTVKLPQGEGLEDVVNRVIPAVQKIMQRNKGRIVCVVSHGIIIALIKCHYLRHNKDKMWKMLPEAGSWEILEV